jgi:ABC-2 type transport system permease protein
VTLAADRWPAFLSPGPLTDRRARGAVVVWRWELAKLVRQTRVRVVVGLCILAPFLVAGAVSAQSAVPQDTLWGQWLHTSGFALPLVVLGFAGQWVLPLLTAVVAGDIFSAEDHFGTWKTILTRSRSRGELFAGKVLAALTYTVVTVVALSAASVGAGLLLGTQPVVGLSGQLVPAGHAAGLVVASWATQVAPVLGFAALAVALSVTTRNSAIGMGGPVLVGLVMQLSTLIDMPVSVRAALLATAFGSWHGLWVQAPFYGPLREGLASSAIWFAVSLAVAWVSFRRRSIRTS